MQVLQQAGAGFHPSVLTLRGAGAGTPNVLSPAFMAQYLRDMAPGSAKCFAREMHDRVAWANESWGAYWAEVLALI